MEGPPDAVAAGRAVDQDTLTGDELSRDRLDHAYALTVHRMQGATIDRAHVLADGGGRELTYVAMSRARDTTYVHAVADDLDQATDDLTREWSTERRQHWVLDTDTPATETDHQRPRLACRPSPDIESARNNDEQDHLIDAEPPDPQQAKIQQIQRRLDRLQHLPPSRGRGLGLG